MMASSRRLSAILMACVLLLAGPLMEDGRGVVTAKVVFGSSTSGLTPPNKKGTAKPAYKTNVKPSAKPTISRAQTLSDEGGDDGDDGDGGGESYVVPFIAGQGLNNQLWEYRGAATLARALNRTVCLEPAHRFYLTTTGREFIPFDELFDVGSISAHARAILGGGSCAKACGGKIHLMLNLVGKPTPPPKNPYNIADWRPGSLIKFGGSTGFRQVPSPTMHLVPRDDPPMSDLSEVSRRLSPVTRGARCVGLQGTAGLDEVGDGDEKRRWTEALKTSPRLIEASNRVHRDLMNGEPYLAIHWRRKDPGAEETKCAGYGVGIGNGRNAGEMQRSGQATKGNGDLCFFAGAGVARRIGGEMLRN